MITRWLPLAALLLAPAALAQAEQVQVGATPSFSFKKPLLFGAGAQSLADLQGKPTMIEFWGVR